MAYICTRKINCQNCPHYRYDEDHGDKCCWASWDEENPDSEYHYEIEDVGFDYDSLIDDYGIITGNCTIYGQENGETTYDLRSFSFEPGKNDVIINKELEDDMFSDEEYAQAEEILLDNILTNIEEFNKSIKPLK